VKAILEPVSEQLACKLEKLEKELLKECNSHRG
jgi:hypothetical protein